MVFSAAQGFFCLLCDGVRMLKREDAKVTPLPACMNPGNNPFHGLAVLEQGVGCLTSVDDLMAYVKATGGGRYPETAADSPGCRVGQRSA